MKQGIIVGASSGIGEQLARQLASKGYQLGLMARRGECLQRLATDLPGEHFVQVTDLCHAEQAQEDLNKLIQRMGDVELIIVNAGVAKQERVLDWAIERQMIDVNVRGFAAMSVVAMGYFMHRGDGHLVGVSSLASRLSSGMALTYTATKAFVSNYLNGMRSKVLYAKLPITVTTVEPGYVDTPMVEGKGFWMAPVDKAVAQLVSAIINKRSHVYITRRWRLVAWVLNMMPNRLMCRLF